MKNKEGFTFFVDEARKWVYNDLGTAICSPSPLISEP